MLVLLAAATALANTPCLDVRNGQAELSLEGRLSRHIFPGAPNFEDVRRGDAAEPTYILTLSRPVCLDDGGDFADPHRRFREVQLFTSHDGLWRRLRAGLGHRVRVRGSGFAAHTGHHHAPLVVEISEVRPLR